MTYTKEQQAENRAKWVEALRSGEYQQGTGRLGSDGSYCCLGVACEAAIRNGVPVERRASVYEEDQGTTVYDGHDTVLPPAVQQWLGLLDQAGQLVGFVDDQPSLWRLNDRSKFTFNQIADVIEEGGVRLVDDTE